MENSTQELINTVILVLSSQGYMLFVLMYLKSNYFLNRFRSFYILIFTVILSSWYVSFWNDSLPLSIKELYLHLPLKFFLGPLLLLSVDNKVSRQRHLIFPLLAFTTFLIVYFFKVFSEGHDIISQKILAYYMPVFGYLGTLHILFYFFRIRLKIKTKTETMLFFCLGVFLANTILYYMLDFALLLTPRIDYVMVLITVFVIYLTGYYTFINIDKYEKSKIEPQEIARFKKKIELYFNNEKPYLDPEINIEILASNLDIHQKKLSEIINRGFNKSFLDLINSYRIEHAKHLIKAEAGSKTTILEIIYSSGFNSKSAFYEIFKKYTGTTPKHFANSYKN